MSFSKFNRNSLPSVNVMEKRLTEAQKHRFDWETVCSQQMLKFLQSHANSIGVPKEFLFFPMLTTIASLLGTNSNVEINDKWKEPAIIWLIIASKKGTNKSGALNLLSQALQEIEEEMAAEEDKEDNDDEAPADKQLVIDHFSFEELFNVMSKNNNTILALYDEMTTFYGLLDLFKPNGSTNDRKTLLNLYNGGKWSRNFRSVQGKMRNTSFNIAGFIQPYYVIELLHRDDHDGFNDRQLFDIPPEIDFDYNDLKTDIPSDIPSFKDIFTYIMDKHKTTTTYRLSEDAKQAFIVYHDKLNERKRENSDSDIRGMLSKAKGQTVRIAMVIHVVHHAILALSKPEDAELQRIPLNVGVESFNQASILMDHFLSIKCILRPYTKPPQQQKDGTEENKNIESVENDKIKKIITIKEGSISPSVVARKSWCLPVNGKYTVQSALQILEKMESYGLGSLREIAHPHNSKKSKVFVRHPYESLATRATEYLKLIDVSQEDIPVIDT